MFHYRGWRDFQGVYRLPAVLNHFCAPGSLVCVTGINMHHIDLGARVHAFQISSSAEQPHPNPACQGRNSLSAGEPGVQAEPERSLGKFGPC